MVEPATRSPLGAAPAGGRAVAPRPRQGSAASRLWPVIAVGVATVVTLVAVIHLAVATQRNGCVFADGDAYCHMAQGIDGDAPFSRRPLTPAIVSVLPHSWSLVTRFQILAVLGALVVVAGTFALTYRLIPDAPGVRTRRLVAALAAADLVALSPHTLRLAFSVPVLVDLPASALGLCWVLLVLSRRRWTQIAAAVGTLPLMLTREAWALPAAAIVIRLAFLRRWWLAASIAALGAAGVVIGAQLPHPRSYPLRYEFELGWKFLQAHPGSPIWRIMLGVGLVPVLVLLLGLRRYWSMLAEPAMSIVLLVGFCHLVQAPIGGSDVPRIASAALPFLVAAGAAVAVRTGCMGAAAGLGIATLIFWRPWTVIAPGSQAYNAFYYPPRQEALQDAVLLSVAAVFLLVGYWSARRNAATFVPQQTALASAAPP